ncbi:M23 family metallopeptidase [Halalkalibaculum sp. DA3122]|uniref:M23 family metallopeptidase n=1 Tax=Halalkalibaculum sp. DA3122 TaxID=3373607 RepID=UPI003754EF01
MRTTSLLWILLIFPSAVSAQFTPDTTDYLWPTNASPYLSGTFGETRSRHFHAALDIKTWGRRGYDVYATRDGQLHRIAIGPGGYGKAIYLKHDDGSYSVYAHLLSFEKNIQQLADSLRFRDYSNKIDIVVDSLEIQINRGDRIAYSGATGIGPPHLHFELRTPSEKPFNPLLTNLSIPDNIPPRFSGLAIEPLSPTSRIEGRNQIYTRRPTRDSTFYDFGTVVTSGRVGLAVDIYDRANRVHNAYAVYDLKLMRDEELLFHSRVDSFSYDDTGQMFLDRIYPLLQRTGKAYQRLYVADGNTLPFYRAGSQKRGINLPEGLHELRIIAEDYNGNQSVAHVKIDVQPRTMAEHEYQTNEPGGPHGGNGTPRYPKTLTAAQDSWQWHKNWININSAADRSQPYTLISIDRNGRSVYPRKATPDSFIAIDESDLLTIHQPGYGRQGRTLHLYRMFPGQQGRAFGDGIRAYATFLPNTVYDTLSVSLTGHIHSADSVEINIQPDTQPLKGSFELTYILDEAQQQDTTLALYEYDKRKGRLNYVATRRGGPVLKAKGDKLGTYYLLPDTAAPEIHSPRILRRADGTWMGMVRAEDTRSGIDYRTTEFYINGVRGIAEFEPEDERILYYHPDFKPASSYIMRVVATDRVGNRVVKEFVLD